jgi:hypothetical protein
MPRRVIDLRDVKVVPLTSEQEESALELLANLMKGDSDA